jgi:hypothetical protein
VKERQSERKKDRVKERKNARKKDRKRRLGWYFDANGSNQTRPSFLVHRFSMTSRSSCRKHRKRLPKTDRLQTPLKSFVEKVDDWVRIQKPVVTYDLGKFSITNCARLPNYFVINVLHIVTYFKTIFKLILLSNIEFPFQK